MEKNKFLYVKFLFDNKPYELKVKSLKEIADYFIKNKINNYKIINVLWVEPEDVNIFKDNLNQIIKYYKTNFDENWK